MTVPDFDAIGEALAARYRSGTLTPPTGYAAVRNSTARLPSAIPFTPAVFVEFPDGELIFDTDINITAEFHVHFLYGKASADLKRDMTGMLLWLGPLLQATAEQMTLGQGANGVKSALPSSFSLEVATFAGQEWYGWDIEVPVILRNLGWTLTP